MSKLFKKFLQSHPDLTLVNATHMCQGIITRIRNLSTGVTELSTIDFYVFCKSVLPFVTKTSKISVGNRHSITNFTQVPKGGKAISTDHAPPVLKLKIKPTRQEVYNFKGIRQLNTIIK